MPVSRYTLKSEVANAFKVNWLPGIILQLFAASICLCFFYWPASNEVFNNITLLKTEYEWKFSLVSTMVFGGIIPFIYISLIQKSIKPTWSTFLFYALFWAIKGVEVDLFYSLQADWFGNNNDLKTIVKKTFIDQFIYSAFWAVPSITLAYLWLGENFNFQLWRNKINRNIFTVKIPTIIVSNWLTWIPAVSIIYMMPAPLQLPLFNLVLCFFVILLSVLTKEES